jgi:hypothetical protein
MGSETKSKFSSPIPKFKTAVNNIPRVKTQHFDTVKSGQYIAEGAQHGGMHPHAVQHQASTDNGELSEFNAANAIQQSKPIRVAPGANKVDNSVKNKVCTSQCGFFCSVFLSSFDVCPQTVQLADTIS